MLDLALDETIMVNDILSAALQELDLMFGTENCELIGYPQFGTNFYQFLWVLNPTTDSLRSYIYDKINSGVYLTQVFSHVNVQYVDENYDSFYYVSINLYMNKEEDGVTRTYKLSNQNV